MDAGAFEGAVGAREGSVLRDAFVGVLEVGSGGFGQTIRLLRPLRRRFMAWERIGFVWEAWVRGCWDARLFGRRIRRWWMCW